MDSLIKLYDCTCIRLDEDIRQISTDEALLWLDNWSSKPTELFDVMLDFLNINKLNIDKLLCYSQIMNGVALTSNSVHILDILRSYFRHSLKTQILYIEYVYGDNEIIRII